MLRVASNWALTMLVFALIFLGGVKLGKIAKGEEGVKAAAPPATEGVRRIDIVNEDGKVVLSIYGDGKTAKLVAASPRGGKTVDFGTLVDKLGRFID